MAHSLSNPARILSDDIVSLTIEHAEHPDISGPVGVLVVPLLASAVVHVIYTDGDGKVRQLTDTVWGDDWRKEIAEFMQAPDARVVQLIGARAQRGMVQ